MSDEAYALSLASAARRVLVEGPPRGLPTAVAAAVTEFLTGLADRACERSEQPQ